MSSTDAKQGPRQKETRSLALGATSNEPLALVAKPQKGELKRLRPVVQALSPVQHPAPSEASDVVIGLREWGTRPVFPLQRFLETSHSSTAGKVRLEFAKETWRIHAPHANTDLRADGVPLREVVLSPGVEITIGPMRLVAESQRTLALREYCARLVGRSDSALVAVDEAAQALRAWRLRRAPLFLRGAGELPRVAQTTHEHILEDGNSLPFIVSDPRREDLKASVRSPQNVRAGARAIELATGGTLVVHHHRLPMPYDTLLHAFSSDENDFRLTVLVTRRRCEWIGNSRIIDIPAPYSRPDELLGLVNDYLNDARLLFGKPDLHISARDIEWICGTAAHSIPELEKATMRIVALRAERTLEDAAKELGMSGVSLKNWLQRRPGIELRRKRT